MIPILGPWIRSNFWKLTHKCATCSSCCSKLGQLSSSCSMRCRLIEFCSVQERKEFLWSSGIHVALLGPKTKTCSLTELARARSLTFTNYVFYQSSLGSRGQVLLSPSTLHHKSSSFFKKMKEKHHYGQISEWSRGESKPALHWIGQMGLYSQDLKTNSLHFR